MAHSGHKNENAALGHLSTQPPSESKLFHAEDPHPEKLYAFASFYLQQLVRQQKAQPTDALASLFADEIQKAITVVTDTGKRITIEQHEKFQKAGSGVPVNYYLVRPLGEEWRASLAQAGSKHDVFHLTKEDKAKIERDTYFFAVKLGAIAVDPEH